MTNREMTADEARRNWAGLVSAAEHRSETTVITRYGRPVAIVGPIDLLPQEPEMPEHFTAWITTDTSCLVGDNADVVVLRDELRGEPDDPDAWSSTGDPLFSSVTAIRADDGDNDEIIREARDLLESAGWELADGNWEAVPTGYIATVTRS